MVICVFAILISLLSPLTRINDASTPQIKTPEVVFPVTGISMASTYLNFDGRVLGLSAWGAAKWVATVTGGTLTGAATNDTLQDLGFKSTLSGGGGHDTYYVVNTETVVVEAANGGTDTVYAYRDYRLTANVENLVGAGNGYTYVGNELDNLIVSKGVRNILTGGRGNDVLVDDSTSTTRFVFAAGDGKDVVFGFKANGSGADLIKLEGYGYRNFDDVKSHMSQTGSDVLITHANGDRILIKDMQVGNLTASNFLLPLDLSNYHATFTEDFNSLSIVNPATGLGTWRTQFSSGSQNSVWTGYSSRTLAPNHELQLYVDPYLAGTGAKALDLNPFTVVDGVATIHGGRTPDALKSTLWGYDYTSGLLTTQTSFAQTYGYFEIRAQLPSGQGVWPAFWLLPKTANGISELDVFEQLGGNTLYQTAHSGASADTAHTGFSTLVPTATSGFHTYGVLWTAETITWYIDGVASASMPTPADMHQPMYMLVNLAIGGDWGGNPGSDFTGADLLVDYVHVYALNDAVSEAVPVNPGKGASSNNPVICYIYDDTDVATSAPASPSKTPIVAEVAPPTEAVAADPHHTAVTAVSSETQTTLAAAIPVDSASSHEAQPTVDLGLSGVTAQVDHSLDTFGGHFWSADQIHGGFQVYPFHAVAYM